MTLNFEFGIPFTTKVHIICDHFEDFVERQKKIWQWYIVKMEEKENHGTNLIACVNHFNLITI